MLKRLTAWAILLTSIFLAACAPHEYTVTVLNNPQPVDDFTLTTHTGDQVALSDTAGQWRVLYFGFTYCPDVCPTTMLEMRQAWEELGAQADDVQFYMISVDPERDTPEALGQYVTNFHPSFIGLRTDDPDRLAKVAGEFGIFYELSDPEGNDANIYDVAHTASTIIINPEGQFIALIPEGTPSEAIAADLQALIRGR